MGGSHDLGTWEQNPVFLYIPDFKILSPVGIELGQVLIKGDRVFGWVVNDAGIIEIYGKSDILGEPSKLAFITFNKQLLTL